APSRRTPSRLRSPRPRAPTPPALSQEASRGRRLENSNRVAAPMERAALITGGSSGIGLAIARALGEDGYRLTISARRPDKLEAAAQQLRDDGFDVESLPANMTDEEEIKKLVEAHAERRARLDVLIN